MSKVAQHSIWFVGVLLLLVLVSCDPARVTDENRNMEGNAWYYKNKIPFDVQIKDTAKLYNVLVNMRITADYKYSNMFVLLHTTNPDKKTDQRRVELKLADESGKWLGNGLGDIYDYRQMAVKKVKFPQTGFYRFELEQNMRDDTLLFVKAVGLRIEEVID